MSWCGKNLWFSRMLVVLLLPVLAGCGFSPLYGSATTNSQRVQADMHAIALGKVPPGRLGQILEHQLEGYFATLGKDSVPPRYRLDMKLKETFLPLIVRQDGSVSRYNIEHTLDIELHSDEAGKAIHGETIKILTGYNTDDSDYASYTARKEAQRRAMHELAQQTKARLMAFLSRYLR